MNDYYKFHYRDQKVLNLHVGCQSTRFELGFIRDDVLRRVRHGRCCR